MRRCAVWIGFGALCLLSGTYWAIPLRESSLPYIERLALLFALLGLIALCSGRHRTTLDGGLRLSLAGIGAFGVPILAVEIARGSVGEFTRSALFAIVPVVVILVITTADAIGGARRLLAPALVGLGGLLLLLPLQFSTSVRGRLMLALVGGAVILAGVCSVRLYRALQGERLSTAIAIIATANALFLVISGAIRSELVWNWDQLATAISLPSLADAVGIALMIWLAREMQPARFAARYLLIPLVTILESYILVRPEGTLRMVFGTSLLATGAGMLLFLNDVDSESILSLR